MALPDPSPDLPDESEASLVPRFSQEEEAVSSCSSHGPFPSAYLLPSNAANGRILSVSLFLSFCLISGQELMDTF